jgi:hypothetical protein
MVEAKLKSLHPSAQPSRPHSPVKLRLTNAIVGEIIPPAR